MNPYQTEKDTQSLRDIFGKYTPKELQFKTRGDYLEYFSKKTNYSIPRIVQKLAKMQDLRTLAYISSRCDKDVLENKKSSWRHAFNSCLFVPK